VGPNVGTSVIRLTWNHTPGASSRPLYVSAAAGDKNGYERAPRHLAAIHSNMPETVLSLATISCRDLLISSPMARCSGIERSNHVGTCRRVISTTLHLSLSRATSCFEGCAGRFVRLRQSSVGSRANKPLAHPFPEVVGRVVSFASWPRGSPDSERAGNTLRGHSADTRLPSSLVRCPNPLRELERVKGIEPSTRSLGSYCSTTELHPRCLAFLSMTPRTLPQNFRVICSADVPSF
jgi:hypothetical protein